MALSALANASPPPPKGEARLGSPLGAATSRWDVAQRPVSAAASVGAGRLPLADSTRGGSRDAGTATAVTERATRSRRARALFSCTGVAFSRRPLARIDSGGTPPAGKGVAKPLFP